MRSPATRLSAALAIGLALASAACGGEERIVYDLRVVSPEGGDPLEGTDVDTLRVHFAQAGGVAEITESAVDDGAFDVSLPLGDANAVTFLGLDFTGATDHLLGALPLHTPAEARLAATLVVGRAGSCATLAGFELAAPASSVGGAAVGTYGLLIGGVEAGGASDRVAYVDLLRADGGALDDAPAALGPTEAVAVTRDIALVLPTESEAFFYDLGDPDAPFLEVELHDGATDGGTLASAGVLGAVVVGGEVGDAPTDAITFVDSGGEETTTSLVNARSGAAVAFDGTRVWIAAGDGAGASSLELATFEGAPGLAIADLGDGVRIGAHLFVSDDGTEALLVGGVDDVGAVRTDTVHVEGCPAACTASPGPTWTSARDGATAVPEGRLLVGGEASALVERVDFGPDGPAFVPRGTLDVARRDAAVIPLAAGIVIVVGGDDGAGPRRDAEICFPDAL